jgi:hypothetical protein
MAQANLEKQLNILDYALSSLWRRRLKSLSVLLVFAAVIFLLASFQMVTQALSDKAKQRQIAGLGCHVDERLFG